MAILTEALSVIIKDHSLRNKFIEGLEEFLLTIPNNTYCSDGLIHRVGFMTPQDAEAFVRNLQRNGLTFVYENQCIDIAVVDMLLGPTLKCNWLGFARQKFFSGQEQYKHSEDDFSIVWLLSVNGIYGIPLDNEAECDIAVSQGWTPDKAIYGNNFIPNEKIKDKLIELGNENGIAKFWFAGTGEVVYVGSPKIKISDNSNKN